MQYQQIEHQYILRIDKGELVHATIHQFCNEHDITNALVSGIGAVEFVRCGYYDLKNKEYLLKEYDDVVEVVSYLGNVMTKEGDRFVHAHATFSDSQNNVFGGHVNEMRVGVVLEVILEPLATDIHREYDETTGLYLMDLANKSIK